ncbi:hypothetical protein K440DRAFT_644118 [Wilcoxina mikolae CBS 423.85]|nr:hypothetical protein K440DRAFT_644118 [Wilcoxina mikolae CBS 423.85]
MHSRVWFTAFLEDFEPFFEIHELFGDHSRSRPMPPSLPAVSLSAEHRIHSAHSLIIVSKSRCSYFKTSPGKDVERIKETTTSKIPMALYVSKASATPSTSTAADDIRKLLQPLNMSKPIDSSCETPKTLLGDWDMMLVDNHETKNAVSASMYTFAFTNVGESASQGKGGIYRKLGVECGVCEYEREEGILGTIRCTEEYEVAA